MPILSAIGLIFLLLPFIGYIVDGIVGKKPRAAVFHIFGFIACALATIVLLKILGIWFALAMPPFLCVVLVASSRKKTSNRPERGDLR